MKIFIIPVDNKFLPDTQPFLYPKYNDDFGVEQDFLIFLNKNINLLTNNPKEADWHYLPVYWTRYHLNRNYSLDELENLNEMVKSQIINPEKTFTVCQFDDGPIVSLGDTLQFLSSKKDLETFGINIPLLAKPIPRRLIKNRERIYLASFQGQFKNHKIRHELDKLLKNRKDVLFMDGDFGIESFVNIVLESYIGICPRGYGGSSFRLYEVMQLSRVPLIIGDVDPRPFKSQLDWESCSFYIQNANEINSILDKSLDVDLVSMGNLAKEMWKKIGYQNWCKFLLKELNNIKSGKENV